MASVNLEMREVERFFGQKGIVISSNNIWLRACVECFRSQCDRYSIKELLDFAFEQWLLADLREVRSSSLPKECINLDKYTLLGKHAVQINYSLDIGTSSYTQLQKIKRPDLGNNLIIESERESGDFCNRNATRSLKLEICDGSLTIIGFEDKPIPSLRNPVPGEKALLKGPVECRKGVLMLTEKNIEVLGGEVDTLLIPNAVGNVLARLLGQPEDPDPYRKSMNPLSSDEGKDNERSDKGRFMNCLDEDNEALLILAESLDKSQPSHQPLISSVQSSVEPAYSNEVMYDTTDFDDEDFDLVAAQTATLAELEASRQKKQNIPVRDCVDRRQSSVHHRTYTPAESSPFRNPEEGTFTDSFNGVEYVDMNDPKRLKRELEQTYGMGGSCQGIQLSAHRPLSDQREDNRNKTSIKEYLQTKIQKETVGGSSSANLNTNRKINSSEMPCRSNSSVRDASVPSTDSEMVRPAPEVFKNDINSFEEDPCSRLGQEPEEMDSELSEVGFGDESPEVFHQPYPPRKFPSLRVVQGRVIRLSEKLTLKNDQWCLSAIVCAKGLEIEMTFASQVLDKVFGVTAKELLSRKNDLKSNPAAKEQMNKLLRDSQLRIKNLHCEMVIRFPSAIAKPVIIDVIQK